VKRHLASAVGLLIGGAGIAFIARTLWRDRAEVGAAIAPSTPGWRWSPCCSGRRDGADRSRLAPGARHRRGAPTGRRHPLPLLRRAARQVRARGDLAGRRPGGDGPPRWGRRRRRLLQHRAVARDHLPRRHGGRGRHPAVRARRPARAAVGPAAAAARGPRPAPTRHRPGPVVDRTAHRPATGGDDPVVGHERAAARPARPRLARDRVGDLDRRRGAGGRGHARQRAVRHHAVVGGRAS
jgi:hypothetical protein